MAGYSASTCDILTLYPLGVECFTIDAYTPFTTDGYVGLIITGGTSPYTTTWSNGTQSLFLNNVQAGTYTAVTTDYFGDFTATTVCEVGSQTFFVEKFTDCSSPSNSIYYTANLNNQVQTGKTYTIVGQLGCWISEGIQLYSAGTVYESFVQLSSSGYTNCTECLPTTPQLENTSGLCLTTSTYVGSPPTLNVNQYQFLSGSTINGYPSWSSNTLTMYYNSTASKWLISGWTESGIPNLQSNLSPPIGVWSLDGVAGDANVTQGQCTTNFVISTNQTNPTCVNSVNGTLMVTSVVGGIPPYTYALNNPAPGNFQNGNIFTGLDDGTYTVYAKDIIGNVGVKNIVLSPQQSITNYLVQLNFVPNTPTPSLQSNFSDVSFQYQISVTPPLPSNKSVTFDLIHTTTISAGTTSTGSPVITYNTSTGATGNAQNTSFNQSTTSNSFPPFTISCHPNYYTTATTRAYSSQITGSGVLKGNIYKKVQVASSPSCNMVGTVVDTITVANITLVNQTNCETINTPTTTITNTLTRVGTILTTSGSQNNQTG